MLHATGWYFDQPCWRRKLRLTLVKGLMWRPMTLSASQMTGEEAESLAEAVLAYMVEVRT